MPILIVEDDDRISHLLQRALKSEHYSVDTAFDGKVGLDKAMKNNYSIILLDIMLPEIDGFTVCQELRKNQIHTPIIMLTARGSMEDKVKGLDLGADDYLVKPFGMDELSARIRTVLRRRKTMDSDVRKIDDLIMDKRKHEVTRAGKVINLTPKEYKLLNVLITHAGQAVKRRQLIDSAWGSEFKEKNNELNVHMTYLRNKIDKNARKPLIRTLRGVGFIINE